MADRQRSITYCDKIEDHSERKGKYRQCKKCSKAYADKIKMESHLFHKHNIFTTQSRFIWRDSLVKQYFTPERNKYFAKCTICTSQRVYKINSKDNLLRHLEQKHGDKLDKIEEEITNSWVLKHFRIDSSLRRSFCREERCKFICRTVHGINFLKSHLNKDHRISEHSESDRGTRSYNVDATIQQPVAEGSYASTSSHHRHRQGDQQSFLIGRYSASSTSTSMSHDNLHGVIQHEVNRSETETIEPMIRPEPEIGIASGFDINFLIGPHSAPSTSTSMSHDNLHGVIQHQSETETIKQMIPPEQERGAAGFNYEECAELFETLQSESETADLLDQTKLFESKDASSQIKPVPCSAKSVDDENVKNLPESKTRKRKSDPTDEDVKNLPESKTQKRKS
ncbi:uncharacterized protein [Temnothorax nylanderi]|uniref:uncharacterized protein n=1 Tax=Temnothorax nylanderi TaxID=102681 RepID=UPI003A899260